jgi:hypothetical protein
MGVFIIPPLPPILLELLQTARSLRSTGITPLRRYCGPLRLPLVFPPSSRCFRLYGFVLHPFLEWDEEGLSSRFVCLCHRAAALTPPEWTIASVSLRPSMLPSLDGRELGLWGKCFSRPYLHSLALRPDDLLTILTDGFVDRLQKFGSPPPRYPSYKALTFTLVGLSPTGPTSLFTGRTSTRRRRRSRPS